MLDYSAYKILEAKADKDGLSSITKADLAEQVTDEFFDNLKRCYKAECKRKIDMARLEKVKEALSDWIIANPKAEFMLLDGIIRIYPEGLPKDDEAEIETVIKEVKIG